MQLLERDRLGDGHRERGVSINVFAEEHALGPGLGGEIDLALLHRDLPRRRLARGTGLGPDHFHGEEIAGDQQCLFRDCGEGERLEGDFNRGFHMLICYSSIS